MFESTWMEEVSPLYGRLARTGKCSACLCMES